MIEYDCVQYTLIFKRSKPLQLLNDFAYCTPNKHLLRKTYKTDTNNQLMMISTHCCRISASMAECRTFSSKLSSRAEAWGSRKHGRFLFISQLLNPHSTLAWLAYLRCYRYNGFLSLAFFYFELYIHNTMGNTGIYFHI